MDVAHPTPLPLSHVLKNALRCKRLNLFPRDYWILARPNCFFKSFFMSANIPQPQLKVLTLCKVFWLDAAQPPKIINEAIILRPIVVIRKTKNFPNRIRASLEPLIHKIFPNSSSD